MKEKDMDLDIDVEPYEEPKERDDDLFNEDLMDDYMDGGGVPPMEKHNDLLKDLTNFAPYLKDTVNGWLGITWNEEEGKYTQNKLIKPIMNLQCAAWCISALKTYTRPNNIITDIGKDEYKNIMMDIVDYIWLNIGTRTEEFQIENNGDVLRICNELEHAASLVLMGAGDGKYNQFLGTVTTRHEQVNPNLGLNLNQQTTKKGIFDRIKKVLAG